MLYVCAKLCSYYISAISLANLTFQLAAFNCSFPFRLRNAWEKKLWICGLCDRLEWRIIALFAIFAANTTKMALNVWIVYTYIFWNQILTHFFAGNSTCTFLLPLLKRLCDTLRISSWTEFWRLFESFWVNIGNICFDIWYME